MKNLLMYSCANASALIEKKHSLKLSVSESLKLRMHLAFCRFCREYKKQSGLIEQALDQKKAPEKLIPADAALREKIIRSLSDK